MTAVCSRRNTHTHGERVTSSRARARRNYEDDVTARIELRPAVTQTQRQLSLRSLPADDALLRQLESGDELAVGTTADAAAAGARRRRAADVLHHHPGAGKRRRRRAAVVA